MNNPEPTEQEQLEAYDNYIEELNEQLRTEGAEELRVEIIRMIDAELAWKTQDEGFRGGLQWVLDKLEGKERI
jgi:hypothetical protein